MPFCPNCGSMVTANDRFCGRCGAPQPSVGAGTGSGAAGARASRSWQETAAAGFSNQTASTLCYVPVVGWIAGLLVLATERFRQERTVRFHAFQGLYLFVTWLLVDLITDNFFRAASELRFVPNPFKLALIGTWIYMLIQTNQGRLIKLPVVGEIAERSVDEQSR